MGYIIFRSFITRGATVTPYIREEQFQELQPHFGKLSFLYFSLKYGLDTNVERIRNYQQFLNQGDSELDVFFGRSSRARESLSEVENPVNLIDDMEITEEINALTLGKVLPMEELLKHEKEGTAHARVLEEELEPHKFYAIVCKDETHEFEVLKHRYDLPSRAEEGMIVQRTEDGKILFGRRVQPTPYDRHNIDNLRFIPLDEESIKNFSPYKTFNVKFFAPVEHEEKVWVVQKY